MTARDALRERAAHHLWLQLNGASEELRETNRLGMVALVRMAAQEAARPERQTCPPGGQNATPTTGRGL